MAANPLQSHLIKFVVIEWNKKEDLKKQQEITS